MIQLFFLIFLAFQGIFLDQGIAWSDSVVFPRPSFNEDRTFTVTGTVNATKIKLSKKSLQVKKIKAYVFEFAFKQCGLTLDEVTDKLNETLQSKDLHKQLLLIHPYYHKKLNDLDVTIVIDAFPKSHLGYSSYFIPRLNNWGGAVIGLDCTHGYRNYWVSSLGHEWVHALIHQLKLDNSVPVFEPWYEEGIAQLVESELGGSGPRRGIEKLSTDNQIPYLFNLNQPLPNSESYGLSYLFMEYIKTHFGGWKNLTSILNIKQNAHCLNLDLFYHQWICTLEEGLNKDPAFKSNPISGVLTPAGVLRYFYTALVLNSPFNALYQIPHSQNNIPSWNGFFRKTPPFYEVHLKYGQALLVPSTQAQESFPEEYEVYRLLKWSDGYQLLKREHIQQIPDKLKSIHFTLDVILMIRTSL